ncbi:MAG: dihydrofolate reductase, partial [Candidatus Scatosoma sp.]
MVRAILHVDKNWGIGKKNALMFSLPKDMKFFRETTSGHTVVLGENTLASLPGGKPLKNRRHIVLSPTANRDDYETVRSLDEAKAAIKRAEERGEEV